MTLYVKIRIPLMSAEVVLRRKTELLTILYSMLAGMFIPRAIEIWKDAPAEAFGGRVVKRREVKNDIKPTTIAILIDRLIKSANLSPLNIIVKINGILKIKIDEEIISLPAYLSMYNVKEWRSIYYDMEFDIFPSRKYGFKTLADLYLSNNDIRDRLNTVIKKIMSAGMPRVDRIVIGYSPDAMYDIRERVETTHRIPSSIIIDVIRTLRLEAESFKSSSYANKLLLFIKPYKEKLIASRLWALKEFKPYFEGLLKISMIKVDYSITKGLMLYALKRESFAIFYDTIVSSFFEPLTEYLIDEEKLIGVMRNIITRTRTLDEFARKFKSYKI